MRLKDVSILNPAYQGDALDTDVSFVPMESLRYGKIDFQEIPFSEGKGKYTFFANGDLLIAKVTPCFENGNIAIANDMKEGIGFGSSEIFVLRMGKSVLNTYMFYFVQTSKFQDAACATMCGVGGLKRISPLFMRTYELSVPSVSVQQRIVDYLDEKTSAIDTRIELLEKKKDAYTRLKKATINQAVTRGLNENVKMKDSGVEWIGMIPEHWLVTRLKDYAKITLGKMIMSNKPESSKEEYTLEKYLKSRNIGWLEVYSNENDVDEMWFNVYEKQIYKLHDGDIVMNEGGDIGKVSLWHDTGYDCYIQNSVNKITPNKHLNSSFLTYFLYATSMTGYFWSIVSQISIAHLTKEKLSYTPIVCPPFAEQQAIAAYLDEKCAKIDAAIANIDKQTDALKRLKRSLINEVITGQRAI